MGIVYEIIKVIFMLIFFLILLINFIGFFQFIKKIIKLISWRHKNKNLPVLKKISLKKHLKYSLLMKKYVFPVELTKWIIYDIVRGKTKTRLFGIWCFTGYFGEGKTLGAIMYALNIQRLLSKVGIRVHIYTNFNLRGQDGKIECWEDLLNLPRNTIVIFDEIQSTFTSQRFKDFPIELLWKITQCRKQGLCIFASSPVFSRMTIQLRESTDYVIVCKNVLKLDRWFNYKFYRAPEYEKHVDSILGLFRHCQRSLNVVASNRDYASYDTTQIVDRLDITGESKSKHDNEKVSNILKMSSNDYNKIISEIKKYVDSQIKKSA